MHGGPLKTILEDFLGTHDKSRQLSGISMAEPGLSSSSDSLSQRRKTLTIEEEQAVAKKDNKRARMVKEGVVPALISLEAH